jgi:hypothetical protein
MVTLGTPRFTSIYTHVPLPQNNREEFSRSSLLSGGSSDLRRKKKKLKAGKDFTVAPIQGEPGGTL